MDFFNNIFNLLWSVFVVFAFISYLFALISVFGDIFRDPSLKGGHKALWMFFLIFFPFITLIIYLIARGGGMAERQLKGAKQAQTATEDYIRSVAGSSADEIAKSKALLDAGTITQAEFDGIKARLLA